MLPDMMLRKRHGWHSSDQDTKRQQACSKQELLLLQAGRGAAVKGGRLPAAAVRIPEVSAAIPLLQLDWGTPLWTAMP